MFIFCRSLRYFGELNNFYYSLFKMEKNQKGVFSSDVQSYPIYTDKQYMNHRQTFNPTAPFSFAANPQYHRNTIQPQAYPQTIPVQNYRVQASSPIRVSQTVLQPQVVTSQTPIFLNANQGRHISYDAKPNVVGMAMPQTNQNVVQTKWVPAQYVPIEVTQPLPVVAVSPQPSPVYPVVGSNIYGEPISIPQAHQRVIVDEPEIYEKRSIQYTPPPPRVAAVPKTVVQETKQQEFKDPMVQTVTKGLFFDAASVRSSRVAPRPAQPMETKTPCATWLLALLGLLGLIGLILAIVLSQNSKNSTTVQPASPTVAEPQRFSSPTSTSKANVAAPIADVSNAEVKGQTVVTTPTPVETPTITAQPIPTGAATYKPTDISLTQPTVTTTPATVLPSGQPQTVSPTFVGSSPSTSTTTQPTTVQPIPAGAQPTTSPSPTTSTTTQPTTVQPTPVQPTSGQPTTTSGSANWIPATSGSTSTTPTSFTPQPTASTTTSVTPSTSTTPSPSSTSVAPQPQSISATPTVPSTTTTTTTSTTSTRPAHFLSLRHHL